MKKTAQEIWQEYEYALQYNDTIGLESRVEKNENFFLGKQWEGVNAPDLDKPVFNILKRVVNYFIAMLVSDNIGVGLSLFNRKSDGVNRVIPVSYTHLLQDSRMRCVCHGFIMQQKLNKFQNCFPVRSGKLFK